MNVLRTIILTFSVLLLAVPVAAVIETYEFSEPELEQRYRDLSQELRCPKCQNQNIADSNAPISQDLRRLLHQQLEAGASDGEILEFMVARYGEFVRYRPAFNSATAILWLAPGLLLLGGAGGLLMLLRGREQSPATLDGDDQARLAALLQPAEKDT